MKFSFRLLILMIAVSSLALDTTGAQPRFHIGTDIARFRGDSSTIFLELYYSFDVARMKFTQDGNAWKSEVMMDVYFKRSSDDSIATRQTWRIPFSTTDSTLLNSSRSYVDVLGFFLKPDIYRLYVIGENRVDHGERDSFSVPLDLKQIERDHISLSDLELCSSIVSVEKDSVGRFIKNTYEVKPNPTRIYGIGQPVVFYYIEEYNLLKNKSPNYYTRLSILNSLGKEVVNRERMKTRVNESNVEVGTVKINTLRTGAYVFNFTVIDSSDKMTSTASKRFFVYNPSLPMDSLTTGTEGSVLSSEYAAMSEIELDREIAQVRYIATREEQNQFKNVKGVDAKRKLLYEFWNRRDDDPSTPGNSRKSEYFKRVDYSNEHFRNAFRDGWKTDRGRVFIVYGPPDEVERHTNEVDTKPYEVWTYNSIQGGVEFVFGDRSGFSDYVLLHSTHRDELHDENWMQQLQTQ